MALPPDLPVELLCKIIKFLPLTDLQTFSLASRLTRSLAIPFIFRHLRCTRDELALKVKNIHQAAGKDLKAAVKKFELFACKDIGEDEDSLVVFRFLETLPNLRVLDVRYLRTAYLSEFISSIRHTTLLTLFLEFDYGKPTIIKGPPTVGLAGLKKLFIRWRARDSPNEPGSSLAHLYELIRPTLTTLVNLRIDNDDLPYVFDLHLLKPAADTLRSFEYVFDSDDESILDTIPEIFPHLRKLSIRWIDLSRRRSILWKDTHIQALSKNNNLTHLTLSSDFEVQDTVNRFGTWNFAGLVCSYKRRLKATQDIALACPRLQRCSWVQLVSDHKELFYIDRSDQFHRFKVEKRKALGGNVTRVVRGIKQWWMGRDHKEQGGIVKCKLGDLPGDIIGQNATGSDSDVE